jgi:hypothetical protein
MIHIGNKADDDAKCPEESQGYPVEMEEGVWKAGVVGIVKNRMLRRKVELPA